MSDENLRTQEEINKDYTECAMRFGDLECKIELGLKEKENLRIKLLRLAVEPAKLKADKNS